MPTHDPLFQRHEGQPVDPVDAVHEVHRFLHRCRAWATERELPKRRARLAESDDPAHAAALHGWLTYVRFLDHTLRELEDGTLDHWFEAAAEGAPAVDSGAPKDGPV